MNESASSHIHTYAFRSLNGCATGRMTTKPNYVYETGFAGAGRINNPGWSPGSLAALLPSLLRFN